MNYKRLFLYLLIGSVGLSALIGIGVTLFGNFEALEVRVLFTTLTVTVTSIFGLACGAFLETGRGKYLPSVGIALSIVAALMCFLVIWDVLDDSEIFVKTFLTATMLAAGCSHLSLLSLARLDRRFLWTQTAAAICITLLIVICLYILWFEAIGGSDLIYRMLGVLGISLASITVVTPILHRLSSVKVGVGAIDAEIETLRQRITVLEGKRNEMSSREVGSSHLV